MTSFMPRATALTFHNIVKCSRFHGCRALSSLSYNVKSREISTHNHVKLDVPKRRFIPNLNPFSKRSKGKRLVFKEQRELGYSMDEMYTIVSEVHKYPEFVPWCTGAHTFQHRPSSFRAAMKIGFPPFSESYTSLVTIKQPTLVRSECKDGRLFSCLVTEWRFSPFSPDYPHKCKLDFFVEFEFKSKLHSHFATVFFDEIAKTMVNSFLSRAESLYGVHPQHKKILDQPS